MKQTFLHNSNTSLEVSKKLSINLFRCNTIFFKDYVGKVVFSVMNDFVHIKK